ncbi:polysaccharide deacetylase family protein [Kitasatospora sp. NPDC101183]|uniref:polysaccharide deacetylase family protein n=1 Tax=Kitasatospora sp. NPDC101183 TaxID=3364100 RepID=UPI00380A82D8
MSRTVRRRPSSLPSTSRRRLTAGCVAVAAALGLAACGTASGALQPTAAPSSSGSASTAPSTAPATIAPSPGADGAPPASPSHPSSSPSGATGSSGAPASTPTGAPAPPPGHTGPTTVIGSTASGGRTVALTFDDGPGPATGQVLDLLDRYGVKATFCQIGQNAAANPALVKRVLAEGHRLCDHSVHHPQPFAKLPHDRAVYEITAARDMIVQAGGPGTKVSWFRAPGGGFNADNEHITASLGMSSLGWSVDPRDWARPGVASIVSTVQHQLKPGGVILMHDGGGDRSQTVAALKQLLPWLVAQGYTFDFPAA